MQPLYQVSVRWATILFHTSFSPNITVNALCFPNTSQILTRIVDFHYLVIYHARQSSRRQWLTAVLSHHWAYGSVLSGSLNLILCPYFTLKYKSPATYYPLFPTYSRKWESFFWLVWLLIIFYMFHWQIIINVLSFAPYSFLYFITTTTRTDFLMFSYTSLYRLLL